MEKVFLGLGTNVGDRKENLQKALKELKDAGISVEKTSSVYETEPIGVTEQQWFYNMVIEAKTDLTPEQLLIKAKEIERALGRRKTFKWGPRLIDIDLLLYDDLEIDIQVEEGHLRVPHEQIKNRAFVVKPLLEIEPLVKLPNGRRVNECLKSIEDQKVRKVNE